MKILMIHHSGLIGGGSKSFLYTNQILSKKNEVVSYIPEYPHNLKELFEEHDIEVVTFPFRMGKITYYSGGNSVFNFRFWYHSLNVLTQINYWKNIINEVNPDLIICNSKVISWMSILFKGRKSICFVRETIKGKPTNVINTMLKNLVDKFSITVFISEYDSEQIELKRSKSIVIPNFIEEEMYLDKIGKKEACKLLSIPSETFNVLFVGGINDLKGIDVALESMNLLKGESINLIIAGNDAGDLDDSTVIKKIQNIIFKRKAVKFSNSVFNYIDENSLSGNVKFIGLQKDMRNAYSASDILIFPMKEPHQSRPTFEIGVQHKPVVISDFENIKEYVKDDYNGLLFKSEDSNDLANKILFLKNNKDMYLKLGDNNYINTMKYHSKERFANSIERLIDDFN